MTAVLDLTVTAPSTALPLPIQVKEGEHICPMTGTTECDYDPVKQPLCPSC